MPHIHDQPGQYDFTASALIFRTDFDEPKVVLHMHRRLNKYLQFGGHVELHEHPWAALAHELAEESGYDLSQLKLLQPDLPQIQHKKYRGAVTHPFPFTIGSYQFALTDHLHTDIAYAFITDQEPQSKPHDGESNDIKLFTRQELIDLPDPDKIPSNVKTIILFAFDNILNHWKAADPLSYHAGPIKLGQ